MSTDCIYCPGKATCKHRDKQDRAQSWPTSHTSSGEIVAPGATQEAFRTGSSLFVLEDLHALRCRLCSAVIPNGRNQPQQRLSHGIEHVREGRVIAITVGLERERAIYFEVRHP
jgi:hypothetical protein